MLLAGVDHITIAPALLRELASTEVNGSTVGLPSLIDKVETSADLFPPRLSYVDDEPAFRMAMTRDKNGTNEAKLVQVGIPFKNPLLSQSFSIRQGLT